MEQNQKREQVFRFLEAYINEHGYGPSVREIGEAVGLRSTATVYYHLELLRQEGRIVMESGKKRAIALPRIKIEALFSEDEKRAADDRSYSRPGRAAHEKAGTQQKQAVPGIAGATLEPLQKPARLIPLVGTVAAGQPILAEEHIEGYLPWEGGEGWFALRVKGESMKNIGILPGDQVVVRPQQTAENGEIVVALLGDEATVKRFFRKNGHVWLLPENEDFEPIDGDEAVILGLVRGVVREYKS